MYQYLALFCYYLIILIAFRLKLVVLVTHIKEHCRYILGNYENNKHPRKPSHTVTVVKMN